MFAPSPQTIHPIVLPSSVSEGRKEFLLIRPLDLVVLFVTRASPNPHQIHYNHAQFVPSPWESIWPWVEVVMAVSSGNGWWFQWHLVGRDQACYETSYDVHNFSIAEDSRLWNVLGTAGLCCAERKRRARNVTPCGTMEIWDNWSKTCIPLPALPLVIYETLGKLPYILYIQYPQAKLGIQSTLLWQS